jgi:hypothetical protein
VGLPTVNTVLGLTGLAFVLAGIVVFVMSGYRFLEDAIATKVWLGSVLLVPPSVGLVCLVLAAWNVAESLSAAFGYAGMACLWATPLAWLICAVICWRTTWKAVLATAVSTGVAGLGFVAVWWVAG